MSDPTIEIPVEIAPAVSVILPIFNVESYLEDCLLSLLAQDFEMPFEILLVNDCSPDDSEAICHRYQKQYPGIVKYIKHEENRGVSGARNSGIDVASGKYLMFVDPDDLLPVNAIASLYHCAIQFNADIVKGNNTIFNEEQSKPASYNVDRTREVIGEDIFSILLKHEEVRGHPWGKLIKKEVCVESRFPENVRMAQDLVFCAQIFSSAMKLILLNECVYNYRLRPEGSTGNKYVSGGYKDWMDSIGSLARFSVTEKQVSQLDALKLRTLNQAVKELRRYNGLLLTEVISNIASYERRWSISMPKLFKSETLGLKDYWRYITYRYYRFYLSWSGKRKE